MEDTDLAIKIPVDLVLKEYECPVCFETIKDASVTKCGHSFCKGCIEECLNRRHECPNCKNPITVDQVFRNFTTDSIISNLYAEILTQEKVKATNEYFNNMFNLIKRSDSYSLNPIQTVFQNNMKKSFLEFERYFEDLRQRNEKIKAKLRTQDLDKSLLDYKIKELDESLARSIEMIVETYDQHMQSLSPSPELLPIRIFLKVPKKNLTIDIHVPRTHTTRDLHQIIFDHYLNKGDPVQNISEGRFLLHQDSEILEIDNNPIGKMNIAPGSTIFFDGDIALKSDAPKECFTKAFKKGENMKTNYFTCFTCNTNWICEACAQSCHASHSTSIAIPNHEPTWACCYCVKKGMCKIPNIKTQ